MTTMRIIAPDSTIGILGGGQLGRMTALAAAELGYKAHIFCQSADEPAAQVSNRVTLASFDDRGALESFARRCDVVTLEWENIPITALEIVNAITPVFPGPQSLAVAQDRWLEKQSAADNGIAAAACVAIESAEELSMAVQKIGLPALLKTRRMGYDGKGQVCLQPGDDPSKAWKTLNDTPAILEAFVDFECEISMIAARRVDGEMAFYPPVRNIHRDGILAETHIPAALGDETRNEAEAMVRRLAMALDLTGLLAVEMFVLKQPDAAGRRVLMNEMAPRPHNSGHWTMDACATSQFTQLIRAICGLPLGSTAVLAKAVMYNLLGDEAEEWQRWLAMPQARLHLYGKSEARPGRKMGHVTVMEV